MTDVEFIIAGWLIDGRGGPIQKDMLLHVKNGHIDYIKKARQDDFDRTDILDLSLCTILPCLIDSHVHLFMSGTDDQKIRKLQLDAPFYDAKDVISCHLNQHLSYGVIAVRDGGDSKAHALRFKRECLDVKKTPIHLKVAGRAWRKSGRYGRLVGRAPSGEDTLAEAIAKEIEDIDHIKIVNSGLNSLTCFGKETLPQFDLKEMKAAVEVANKRGLKTMVHANGKIPVKIAVESGCRSIEHGFFMGKENLQKMADKHVTWVPTSFTMKAYTEHLKPNSIEAEVSRRKLDHQLEQIYLARELGVPVALGTDAGSLGVHHGISVIEELKLLVKAGFSIQEAVKCATFNGAELLDLKELGAMVPGRQATFIAVKADPSNLPDSLKMIEGVYIKGRRLSS